MTECPTCGQKMIFRHDYTQKFKHNGKCVIAYCDNAAMIFGFMTSDGYWVELGSEIPYTVTHWMPMPEPPTEG